MMFLSFAIEFFRNQWAKVSGYRVIATPEEQAKRLAECEKCPFVTDDGLQCSVCKCLTWAKVVPATTKCPKGKWPAIWKKKA